jgi:hypothetical protein
MSGKVLKSYQRLLLAGARQTGQRQAAMRDLQASFVV